MLFFPRFLAWTSTRPNVRSRWSIPISMWLVRLATCLTWPLLGVWLQWPCTLLNRGCEPTSNPERGDIYFQHYLFAMKISVSSNLHHYSIWNKYTNWTTVYQQQKNRSTYGFYKRYPTRCNRLLLINTWTAGLIVCHQFWFYNTPRHKYLEIRFALSFY